MKPRTAKPALSLWLIDHRKAATMKPADVARAVGVSEDTVRGWEAGRGIGPDSLPALEELFGEPAPAAGTGYAGGDLAAAITALVGELQQWRTEDRERIAALERFVLGEGAARRAAWKRRAGGASRKRSAPPKTAG